MDPIVEDAAGAVDDFSLERLHYTYSMIDLATFREDYRYLVRNRGEVHHKAVPLLWRWREVQANMTALDPSNANLVYLPSQVTIEATERYLIRLMRRGFLSVGTPPPALVQALEEISKLVKQALFFESGLGSRAEAHKLVEGYALKYPQVEEFRRAAVFLSLAFEFYLPFALLSDPVPPQDFAFVRHGVDLYIPLTRPERKVWPHLQVQRVGVPSLLRFFLTGSLVFRVPLAVEAFRTARARSFHCRVVAPSGLRIASPPHLDPHKAFFDYSMVNRVSYDETNLYLYFGEQDLELIHNNQVRLAQGKEDSGRQVISDLRRLRSAFPRFEVSPPARRWWNQVQARFEERARVRLEVRTKLGIGRGIGSMVMLLWLIAIGTVLAGAYGFLDLDRFLTLLGLLLVVVLTIGVFSVDKRILGEFVSAHALSAVVVCLESFLLSVFL